MTEVCRLSESDEGELKSEHEEEELPEELLKFPKILEYIKSLQRRLEQQKKKIAKLKRKLLKSKKEDTKSKVVDAETQTAPCEISSSIDSDWCTDDPNKNGNLVEQITQAAESALRQTGFVYEETSGLYYDYNSGYYYDAAQGLYYDGHSGAYYSYDKETKSYKFHSQVQTTPNEAATSQTAEKADKRKAKMANKDEAKKRKVKHPREKQESGEEREKPEEGECSDSDNSRDSRESSSDRSISQDSADEGEQDIAKIYPPCMRIIVKETNLKSLKVGALFLVAYPGGSLGREGDHSVLIPDPNISKHHARFQYDEEKKLYTIVDSGSRNGTLLNGTRLSVAKQESEPCEVAHGSVVQVQGTKLLCHIHNGHVTCGHCEPGLVQRNASPETSRTSKKDRHKSELRRLKNKFGVEKNNVETASQVASGYQDRAQARRVCVGSSNHHVKTQQSCVETSIAKDNKGFKLLSKMGWSEGQSLGKDGDGRTEPVPMVNKQSKAGFGAPEVEPSSLGVDPNIEKKQKLWKKTQQRYNAISKY